MKKMTQEEFLIEMLDYYSPDPENKRCVKDGETTICAYSPKTLKSSTTEGCAIGRHLPPELAERFDIEYPNSRISSFYDKEISNLPTQLKDLTLSFLVKVQNLHDIKINWAKKGLSAQGIDYVNKMCNSFGFKINIEKYGYKS